MKPPSNPKRFITSILLGIFAIMIGVVILSKRPSSATDSAESPQSEPTPSAPLVTKSSQRDRDADQTIASEDVSVTGSSPSAQNQSNNPALNSPHWSNDTPSSAPVIPPGFEVSKPEVTANIDGKNQNPKFHGSFSERMSISPSGTATLAVHWPVEHKTEEVLASTLNDGTINGEHGAILKRSKDGKFRLTFQAGQHPGATQVILRAANLAYTLNFWVPTGNANVDPPSLQ